MSGRINEWLAEMRPRERLLTRGLDALAPHELVALLLGGGTVSASACELGSRLLLRCGGMRGLARMAAAELMQVHGVGPARACRLAAAFEVGRRAHDEARDPGSPIQGGRDVWQLLTPRMKDLRKEVFVALLLDGRHRLAAIERVSEGTLTSSIVHPREVFAPAIRASAAALIVAHNHPSGDPTPSREDIEVTRRLREVGELVGIRLLDHVIVGDPDFVSLRELGHFDGQCGEGWSRSGDRPLPQPGTRSRGC